MTAIRTARVQSRGQVTLPKAIRSEAGISPGDLVLFKVVGPSKIEIETIAVKPLEYFLDKFSIDGPFDDERIREEWQSEAASRVIGE